MNNNSHQPWRSEEVEDRFFAIFDGVTLPKWCRVLSPATPEQQGKGIDALMWTDAGIIYIQFPKSLPTGKKPHRRRYPKKPIGVVIVDSDNHSDAEVRQKTFAVARELRRREKRQR